MLRLFYVAAGKIHKKFTLLGHPKSKLAAAVVEGNRFSYVYKHTQGRERTGDSQVMFKLLTENALCLLWVLMTQLFAHNGYLLSMLNEDWSADH